VSGPIIEAPGTLKCGVLEEGGKESRRAGERISE
jgi:hypothetical protein